jgi:hypothetical protein
MASPMQLMQSAAEQVEAYCGLWREQGAAWWTQMLQPPVPLLPAGWHWSARPREGEALLRTTLWPAKTAAGLVCDIRIEPGVEIHGSVARRRLLTPAERHLLVTFSRASDPMIPLMDRQPCAPAPPRTLTVVVGLEGLPQEERNTWNRYVKREPSTPGEYVPRLLWSTLVRTEPWNLLFAAGWCVLYVAGPQVARQQALDDIMAHCALYLWQAQLVARDDVAAWLQGYIRRVCPAVSPHEADYLLEVCKAFALPLHAHSLRAALTAEQGKNRRAEAADPRLVRGIDLGAMQKTAGAVHEESAPMQGSGPPPRKSRRRNALPADARALSTQQFVARTGLKLHQVKHGIRTGGIVVERRGYYWQFTEAEARRQTLKKQIKTLEKELLRLRVLWKMRGPTTLEDADTLRRAWDAARKWLKEQQKKQKSPAEVYVMIAAAPAIQALCHQEPALLSRAQALLDHLGPQIPWSTKPLGGQQDGPQ